MLAEQEVADRGIEVTDADLTDAETGAGQRPRRSTTATDSVGVGRRRRHQAQALDRPRRVQARPGQGHRQHPGPAGRLRDASAPPTRRCEGVYDAVERHPHEPGLRQRDPACSPATARRQDPTTGAAAPPPDADYADGAGQGRRPARRRRRRRLRRRSPRRARDDPQTGANGGDLGCSPIGAYASSEPEFDGGHHQPAGRRGRRAGQDRLRLPHRAGPQPRRPHLRRGQGPARRPRCRRRRRAAFQDWFDRGRQGGRRRPSTRSTARGTRRPAPVVPPEGATTSTTAPATRRDRSTRRDLGGSARPRPPTP